MVVGATLTLQLLWVGIGHGLLPHVVLVVGMVLSAATASVWLTLPAALAEAGLSFLVIDGFVDGSYGTLTWDGTGDLALITALVLACLLAAEAAYDLRWSRPDRRERPPVAAGWWHDDDLVELSLTLPDPPDDRPATAAAVDDAGTPIPTARAPQPTVSAPPTAAETPEIPTTARTAAP